MQVTLTVDRAEVVIKSGISKKSGQPYNIPEQPAMLSLPNGERRRIALQHENGEPALPVGDYQPKGSALYVDKFGGLSISTRAKHWEPLPAAAQRKAA